MARLKNLASQVGEQSLSDYRSRQAIHSRSGTTKERGFFVDRTASREALAGIPQDCIAAPALLHGEITFEHASASAKLFDAYLEEGTPCGSNLFG